MRLATVTLIAFRRSLRSLCLGSCVLAFAGGCNRIGGDAAEAAPRQEDRGARVKVVRPTRQDIVRRVTLPATVRADLEVTLHGKVSGYVKSIVKDRGDRVKAGEVIATLEVPEMLLELESAGATFALEDATLRRMEATRKIERSAVTDQDLDLAKAKRAVAEASLKRLKTLLNYAEIRAPFDGFITERFVDPGAFVQQAKIVSIVDLSIVRVLVDVPESEVRFASVGATGEIHLESLPGGVVSAKVVRTATALDPATRTMRVELDVPNPGHKILPGTFARVALAVERRTNALVIPSQAVVTQHEKAFVFVNAGGVARKLAVTLGLVEGERIEAASGLTGEESIILPIGKTLSDGMLVRTSEGG
jgi:membrane fusion protein (multidrug efflux system)